MFDQERTDLFLLAAFGTIVLTVLAVSLGYPLSMFAGIVAFVLFVYLWLMSGLEETNGDSTGI